MPLLLSPDLCGCPDNESLVILHLTQVSSRPFYSSCTPGTSTTLLPWSQRERGVFFGRVDLQPEETGLDPPLCADNDARWTGHRKHCRRGPLITLRDETRAVSTTPGRRRDSGLSSPGPFRTPRPDPFRTPHHRPSSRVHTYPERVENRKTQRSPSKQYNVRYTGRVSSRGVLLTVS